MACSPSCLTFLKTVKMAYTCLDNYELDIRTDTADAADNANVNYGHHSNAVLPNVYLAKASKGARQRQKEIAWTAYVSQTIRLERDSLPASSITLLLFLASTSKKKVSPAVKVLVNYFHHQLSTFSLTYGWRGCLAKVLLNLQDCTQSVLWVHSAPWPWCM